MKDKIKVSGRLKIELFGPDGKLKLRRICGNLVVTTGLNYIADQLSDRAISVMSHMAIGTGTTAPAAGDTTLETEIFRASLTSTTRTNNIVSYIADYAAGDGTGSITEAGLFNAASGGTMMSRLTFTAIEKAANDTLRLTWQHTYSAA